MGEVKHYINGKKFKDYGVYISSSDSYFDFTKIKNLTKYDWKEYHGHSVNLDVKKLEARVITLRGFVKGSNWLEMRNNFYNLFSELNKPGTQRYVVDAFGYDQLAYEVYRENDINLVKHFKDGMMVGLFDLQLIEPNPVKRILKLTGNEVELKIEGETVAEIFWGNGTKTITNGNFFQKYNYTAPDYTETTQIPKTATEIPLEYEISATSTNAGNYVVSAIVSVTSGVFGKAYLLGKKNGAYSVVASDNAVMNSGSNLIKIPFSAILSEYERFVLKVLDDSGAEIPGLQFVTVNIYNANIEQKPTVTGEKIIIVAGNIEELTITTDAEVLWTEL